MKTGKSSNTRLSSHAPHQSQKSQLQFTQLSKTPKQDAHGTQRVHGQWKDEKSSLKGATSQRSNSILFGEYRFDPSQHLLYLDARCGDEYFQCSISETTLRRCFHAGASSEALTKCAKQNQGRIIQVLARKKAAGQWKTPQKEIRLDEYDFQTKH